VQFYAYVFFRVANVGTEIITVRVILLGKVVRSLFPLDISGPSLGAKTKVMSFNRTWSRAVIGLLTGHNTLRRHLYLLGLQDSPLCRKCGVTEETSAHILCECGALASLRHAYLGFFFLEPKDIQNISLGPSGASVKLQGSLDWTWGTKGQLIKA
jgi:hypothetical protein